MKTAYYDEEEARKDEEHSNEPFRDPCGSSVGPLKALMRRSQARDPPGATCSRWYNIVDAVRLNTTFGSVLSASARVARPQPTPYAICAPLCALGPADRHACALSFGEV